MLNRQTQHLDQFRLNSLTINICGFCQVLGTFFFIFSGWNWGNIFQICFPKGNSCIVVRAGSRYLMHLMAFWYIYFIQDVIDRTCSVWILLQSWLKTKSWCQLCLQWWHQTWNGNVILMNFSSMATLEVVILTTSSAATDENFINMMTFP